LALKAPFADLKKMFGFTADRTYDEAKKQLARVKSSH
jgi:transketolase